MQSGSLTSSEALSIIPCLCDALQYAYEHDVLHRDIKPWLSDTAAHGDQLQAAAALDISETAVRVQVHRMQKIPGTGRGRGLSNSHPWHFPPGRDA